MLWLIIQKELLANLISFRFLLVFLLCTTLILVSAYTMRDSYQKRVQEYSAAINLSRQQLAQQDGKRRGNPTVYRLDKPPLPLSALVEGMETSAGKFVTVGILTTPRLEGVESSNPGHVYFGTLDVGYIVRVVLSLVAILLTYDALSGEREQGTLKLILSHSVPRDVMLLAKCIASYLTMLLCFLVPMLMGLLILMTSDSISLSGTEWSRLGLILLTSLLYIGFFLMLGLLVSSRSHRSNTSLMMLLFLWVVLVLAVPKVSMILASRLSDVPSLQSIQVEIDMVSRRLWGEYRKKVEQIKQEHPSTATDVLQQMQGETGLRIAQQRWEIQTSYDRKVAAEYRLAANLSRLSPAAAYAYAAVGLAAARRYQVGVAQYYYETIRLQALFQSEQLPSFDLHEFNLSESWNLVKTDMLILILLVVCSFMMTYVSFLRSDVR